MRPGDRRDTQVPLGVSRPSLTGVVHGPRLSAPPIPLVLAVAAVTLVLSPIIAVWAAALGAVLCVFGFLLSSIRTGPAGFITAIGAGLLLGSAPYFALALLQ